MTWKDYAAREALVTAPGRPRPPTLGPAAALLGKMSEGALDADELLSQGSWLRRLARSLVDESAAEDVLQETYAAALSSPPGPGQPLRPWLTTVLRNFARMRFRAHRRRQQRERA